MIVQGSAISGTPFKTTLGVDLLVFFIIFFRFCHPRIYILSQYPFWSSDTFIPFFSSFDCFWLGLGLTSHWFRSDLTLVFPFHSFVLVNLFSITLSVCAVAWLVRLRHCCSLFLFLRSVRTVSLDCFVFVIFAICFFVSWLFIISSVLCSVALVAQRTRKMYPYIPPFGRVS